MKILSLFDGISCGMIALKRAGVNVEAYYASEIDISVIKVSKFNYPEIINLGDIEKWRDWDIDFSKIDLIIGGSPCQGFSTAGKELNFDDPRSKLFFCFSEILNHARSLNKNVKFLFENVLMKKEYQDIITKELKSSTPIIINSRLVSAQDRKRLYWSNFWFNRPHDIGVSISSVIGDNVFAGSMRGRRVKDGKRSDYDADVKIEQYIECRKDNKSNCVTTVNKDNVVCNKKQRFTKIQECEWRYYTPEELEQLQTIPIGYTDCGISKSARCEAIGNAWTVDVIAHIFKFLPREVNHE
jgi:site-specific DNA-cytosine methylase